jgi:MraZ protein
VFVGVYDRSVDGNGRLALPSTFRDLLGERCYVTTDPGGFVAITTVDNFEADASTLLDDVRRGALPDSALRNFGVNSWIAAVDKQGRITLDEATRVHAGIRAGAQATLAGAINRLEVWRPSRYATIRGEDSVVQPSRIWPDEEDER